MITLSGFSTEYIKHFRGLSTDVAAGKHIPNAKGVMACTGVKVGNGAELFCMDTGDTYLYDEENKVWIQLQGVWLDGRT